MHHKTIFNGQTSCISEYHEVKAALKDFRDSIAVGKVQRFGLFVVWKEQIVERWWNDTDRGKHYRAWVIDE